MKRIPIEPSDPLPHTALIKIPKQPRSIEMVHSILNAGMEIIRNQGLQSMSTNRVAEQAGISIGSLYQYFSNRESILSGIVERSLMDIDQLLQSILVEHLDVPAEQLLTAGLTIMLSYYDEYLDVLRPILRDAPLLAHNSAANVMEKALTDLLHNYLLHNNHRYRLTQGYAGIYVGINSLIFTYLKWIVEPSPMMTQQQLITALVAQMMASIDVVAEA